MAELKLLELKIRNFTKSRTRLFPGEEAVSTPTSSRTRHRRRFLNFLL